jgi:hypothetical protein
MHDLTPLKRCDDASIIDAKSCVNVIGRPRPFQARVTRHEVQAGSTVEEALDHALRGEQSSLCDYVAYLDGEPIAPERRALTRCAPGQTVTFAPRLQKGGVGKALALIAVAIVAIVATIVLGPIFGPTIAGALATALISTGIVVGGTLAVNALFPTAPSSSPTTALETAAGTGGRARSNVYSISGASNRADPFGPIPCILGRVRIYPRYGALPITEFAGDDQYLRLLFVLGYGPLSVSSIKIGETDIDDFDDVDYEVLEGDDIDDQPEYYPKVGFETSLSIELTPADWMVRTTPLDVREITIDIVAPGGIRRIVKETGKTQKYAVEVESEYRLVGAGSWSTLKNWTINEATEDPVRRNARVTGLTPGQYEVRVRRGNNMNAGDDVVVEDIYWTALRSFRKGDVVNARKPVAMISVRIRATAQLNNVIDTLNCICTSVVEKRYDPDDEDWDNPGTTRNNAALFVHVLQGPAIRTPVADAFIDWDSLAAWSNYCGDEGWTYDREHDTSQSVLATLQDIAAAGRARVTRTDGIWGVIFDEADVPIAQHFTPRNSWGFTETRVYQDFPHAIRAPFINEDKGFRPDERIVYDDGFSASNATKFVTMDFPGVIDSARTWRHARFQMAQMRLRPSIFTLSTNWQALACTVGSRVYVNSDVTFAGTANARVKSVNADHQWVDLDSPVVMEADVQYGVRFRLKDNTTLVREVETNAGQHTRLTLVSDTPMPLPEAGDLALFGELDSEAVILRVLNIEWQKDLRATITLVDDAPEVSDADGGEIPPYDSQVTVPPDLFTIAPGNLTMTEFLYLQGNVAKAGALLSWQTQQSAMLTGFEIEMRDDTSVELIFVRKGVTTPEFQQFKIFDVGTDTYSFRVRSTFRDGTASAWNTLNAVNFLGLLAPPPDVTGFEIQRRGAIGRLVWDDVNVLNLSHYVIRFTPAILDVTWGGSLIIAENVFDTFADVELKEGTYLIKAVTVEGISSLNPAILQNDVTGIVDQNVVEILDEDPTFAGVKDRVFFDESVNAIRLQTGWAVAADETLDDVDSGWAGITLRQLIPASEIENEDAGSLVRVVLNAGIGTASIGARVAKAYIGLGATSGDAYDFDGAPVQLLFDGDPDVEIAPSGSVTSDGAALTIPPGRNVVVSIYFDNVSPDSDVAQLATTTWDAYWKSGDDAATENATGYTTELTQAYCVSSLQIGGSNETEGYYYFDNMIDLFEVYTSHLTSNLLAYGENVNLDFYDPEDFYDLEDFYGGENSEWLVTVEFRSTNDDPNVSPVDWSEWATLVPADYTARAFQFRAFLQGLTEGNTPFILELGVTVDMPDRFVSGDDVAVGTGGLTIVFDPPFLELRGIAIAAQDLATGDRAVITNKDEEGFDIIFRDASNSPVARTFDYIARGWGRRLS